MTDAAEPPVEPVAELLSLTETSERMGEGTRRPARAAAAPSSNGAGAEEPARDGRRFGLRRRRQRSGA